MIRKGIYVIISLAILAGGYMATGKLNYWQRSTGIFRMKNDRESEARGGRGGFESGRSSQHFPGSIRRNSENESAGMGSMPESSSKRLADGDGPGRGDLHGNFRGRDGFNRGRKVNLTNVSWFLLVFASFTVIVVYVDKTYCYFRKRRYAINRHEGN